MDVAMALAILFFCLLLLSSAAITFLLLRHCLSGLRRRHRAAAAADDDAEAAEGGAGARQLMPPCSPPPQQELPLLRPAAKLVPSTKEEGEPRKLTWREVEALTGGFDEAAVVGRGGSSTVYLASSSRVAVVSPPVAVKVHRWCGGERWLRAFRQELDLLHRLRHPHIVSLLAYSDDHEEGGALVLEYLSGGTLADRLHGGASPPLPWRHRMRVVHDVAGALEHLHDGAPPVVHGDVSASNVLLDGRGLGARLCDLGSACEGFSAAVAPTRAAVGSPGYVDPFFLRTGIVSKKSDVYSFGVLLLEAITGSPAAGIPGPDGGAAGGGNLTARLLPRVRTEGVDGLADRRLGDDYDAAEAGDVARIAVECLAAQPGLRPTMAQVRAAIAEKAATSISTAHHDLHASDST
uniref:Protein kinase domain-containing protein n=1 Tax=Oryza meridionalis TaxID=40149 RepID=A0A0E0CHK6_9ORYZ